MVNPYTKITLKPEYTLEEAKAASAQVLDIIEGLDYEIQDRLVAKRTRRRLEAQRRGYITLLSRIERRIIETLWRYTLVLTNLGSRGIHGRYFSAIFQAWVIDPTKNERRDVEEKALEELTEYVGEYVGYASGLWWFELDEVTRKSSGWQKVDYEKKLVDSYYEAIEEEDGSISVKNGRRWEDRGKLDEL